MDDKIKELLTEEIITELENLKTLDIGSEEKSKAISDLVKLHNLKIEEIKIEQEGIEREFKREQSMADQELKGEQLTNEQEFRGQQLNEQTKDRYLRLGVEILGVTLPLVFYAAWMTKGFEFEKEGVITSSTFKGLINRFKTTK